MNSNSRMTENEYVFDECPTCGCQTAGELSKLVAQLREQLAVAIGALKEECYCTDGGTYPSTCNPCDILARIDGGKG